MKDKNKKRIEYIWLDGNPDFPQLRSKARYINIKNESKWGNNEKIENF